MWRRRMTGHAPAATCDGSGMTYRSITRLTVRHSVIRECKTDLIPLKVRFPIEDYILLRSEVMTNYM
jgi:hypothetical protein